jgi:two-component system, OmpR family, phosphate regulon sensor histidine kinase PhoR
MLWLGGADWPLPLAYLGIVGVGISWAYQQHQLRRQLRRFFADPLDNTAFDMLPVSLAGAAQTLRRHIRTNEDHLAQALRHSAQEQAIFATLEQALVQTDESYTIRFANRAAYQLLGEVLEGRPLAAVVRHPDILASLSQLHVGKAPARLEVTIPAAVMHSYLVTLAAIEGGYVLSWQDITPLKYLERQRGDFVANASHELRTPLASLIGFIETLQGPARQDSAAQTKFLAIMHAQASRMARLVADLLSLSRIEMEAHIPPQNPVTLPKVIEEVVAGATQKAERKQLAIECLVLDKAPIIVPGQADQLSQIVQNLLDNALTYSKRPGTKITISLSAAVPHSLVGFCNPLPMQAVELAVRDEGEGIASEHIPRLTERFYRVDAARSREQGGTGLGLAIVKHIIKRHQGRLHIESTPGKGSCFRVTLPALPQ